MADEPIPSSTFDDADNHAIIAAGRNPSSLSAVFEATFRKSGDINTAAQAEFEAVFGVNAKRDHKGNPIEVGKGSKVQQTSQHRTALQKAEGRV
ncbi:hypothetical protein UP10_14490 [Bradyrhizobium sp. LTSPM299]|uniref:hypothetical protein n=1 Tax=Bradyrhizobium sp. LTSPM299 TaxID=1619233 RepID=UPI0005C993AC|nr:hypothetical protein [Bradyrhizobium sp. LTSPM299]KJC59901.1 hypothetical protein UP10_14490 [Bradyrhizobium sp. LTSPM299]